MNFRIKRLVCLSLIIVFSVSVLSCSGKRFYKLINAEPLKPSLQQYNKIHVGWLPINDNEWKTYEYGSKVDYTRFIRQLNIEYLQDYIQSYLPKKQITGVKSKEDAVIPNQTELIIKFKSIDILHRGQVGVLAVHFIDAKTNNVVYKVSSEIYCKGVQWGFEPQLMDLMNYIGNFIDYQFRE